MEDAGEQRDLLADEAVGVAGAVVPLVVVADERALGGELVDVLEDLLALGRVLVHEDPLLARELLRLQQDGVADADLADVVEKAGPLELLQVGLAEVHGLADLDGDARDVLGVLLGAGVAGIDGRRQGLHGLREHLADVDDRLVGRPRRVERQRERERHEWTDAQSTQVP